ncbi:Ribonuclease VapC [uncultured Pleomorphomonas sp.]|uniref:Ribonuclease VapC n=1 Tax=uncultured Pleomorphomonas sp. TaxID=442121 RepID=A0A212LAK0_9HYPH|nr:type II toxin-antitoxin system VapC family toxin [uncultured Pleomorphomonas sp.]SCM74517.1 Ribonuclease VapC [uncultured Pleomorphomonas sp.]
MRFLIDTNVLSAGTAVRAREDVVTWMERNSADLALSVVTVSEIVSGIAKLRREGATSKAERLAAWWAAVEHLHAGRFLAFGLAEARIAGEMSDRARGNGHAPGFADVAIAATAEAHGLVVLTRNVRHFSILGVSTADPFEKLPSD